MPQVKIASLSKLPNGTLLPVEHAGDQFAVCHAEGEIHVLDGYCPHAGGPLGQGALHGTTVVCPWHAWEFDCRTGACDFNEEIRVAKFPVTISGDDILIEIDA